MAKKNKSYLLRKRLRFIDNWPAYSPDLNPIEMLWALLKKRVSERHHPETAEELKAAVKEEWEKFPQVEVNRIVKSFERKLRSVLALRGF